MFRAGAGAFSTMEYGPGLAARDALRQRSAWPRPSPDLVELAESIVFEEEVVEPRWDSAEWAVTQPTMLCRWRRPPNLTPVSAEPVLVRAEFHQHPRLGTRPAAFRSAFPSRPAIGNDVLLETLGRRMAASGAPTVEPRT